MTISGVVNGHLMVIAKMMPTPGTCLFPARNHVEYVTRRNQEAIMSTGCEWKCIVFNSDPVIMDF